jgi:hypothetical protein
VEPGWPGKRGDGGRRHVLQTEIHGRPALVTAAYF